MRYRVLALFAVLLTSLALNASQLTFFGEDLNNTEFTPLASHPNADAARNNFLASLVGVGTENFEGFSDGTPGPLLLTFPGAGTATLSGSGNISAVTPGTTNGVGRYAISGSNFWETSQQFNIAFSSPVAAFGFYGVDIGDFGGQVTLTTTNGMLKTLTIPNTVGSGGSTGGSVLYFGLIDTDTFVNVSFGDTQAGSDYFAFDDMTIGSLQQVKPVVPEPATMLLFGSGLAGLAGVLRKKKH